MTDRGDGLAWAVAHPSRRSGAHQRLKFGTLLEKGTMESYGSIHKGRIWL